MFCLDDIHVLVRHIMNDIYLMLNDTFIKLHVMILNDTFIKLHEMSTGKNISIMRDQDFIKQNTAKRTCRLSAVIQHYRNYNNKLTNKTHSSNDFLIFKFPL